MIFFLEFRPDTKITSFKVLLNDSHPLHVSELKINTPPVLASQHNISALNERIYPPRGLLFVSIRRYTIGVNLLIAQIVIFKQIIATTLIQMKISKRNFSFSYLSPFRFCFSFVSPIKRRTKLSKFNKLVLKYLQSVLEICNETKQTQ